MNDAIFSDTAIQEACQRRFNVKLVIAEVVARNLTAGTATQATLFKTSKGELYLYIASQSNLLLADVLGIVRSMNMETEGYLAPYGDKEYFHRIGVAKFKKLFPGKKISNLEDTQYYETLAAYNPALVRIASVKGFIRGYIIAQRQWRKVKEFSYSAS